MLIWLLSTLIFSSPVLAQDDPYVIQVKTQATYIPVVLSCHYENKGYEDTTNVLEQDLKIFGNIKVSHPSDLQSSWLKQPSSIENWPTPYIKWALDLSEKNGFLEGTFWSFSKSQRMKIGPIKLSPLLAARCKQVHKLADSILEIITEEKSCCQNKLLFVVDKGHEHNEIWESDSNGENCKKILEENCISLTPCVFSNADNADKFLYVSYRSGTPKIILASKRQGPIMRFTGLRGNQYMPCLCANEQKAAFVCDADGQPQIYIQTYDLKSLKASAPQKVFNKPKGTQGSPSFSPNGSQLAFVSNVDGHTRIYLLNVENKNFPLSEDTAKKITKKSTENTSPCWSPDGSKIAYSAKTSGVRQIWIYDLKTSEETCLTEGPLDKENPSWAPNSRHLVYTAFDKTSGLLYSLDTKTKNSYLLNTIKGTKRFAVWQNN